MYCLMHISFYSGDTNQDSSPSDQAGEHRSHSGLLRLNLKKQLLNFATIAMITLYLVYNVAYFVFGCTYEFDEVEDYEAHVYKPLQVMTQVLFTTLAVLFIVIAIILIRKLKQNFKLFYDEFRNEMLIATCMLTVPLTFRAIFDGIKIVMPTFMLWINDSFIRNSIYNFFFFILTTYLPIIGQITSLVFGFVRHR